MNMYQRFFSIREIEQSIVLKWGLGALLFGYFTALYRPPTEIVFSAVKTGSFVCPPYFQDCSWLYFFQSMPYGYSQSLFYAMILGLMAWVVYRMYEQDWVGAHMAMMPIFVWHTALTLFLSDVYRGNYEYYLIIFGASLLLLPHKEFFTKLLLVLFYVLSTFTKIHPGWVLGTYFSSMKLGLPLFPDWSIVIWTNLVIAMEMIGAWFLLSRNVLLQRCALVFFVIFHVYSVILVGYRYPSNVLPMLVIMFGPMYRWQQVPLDKKSIAGFMLVGLCILAQLFSHIIPGDEKLTLEGNNYGLYMFEANHQCVNTYTVHYNNGEKKQIEEQSDNPRNRCNPYSRWFRFNTACKENSEISSIEWKFDHSVNGGPFLRIVEEENICDKEYKPFERNTWIKSYEDSPEVIGRPVENYYY